VVLICELNQTFATIYIGRVIPDNPAKSIRIYHVVQRLEIRC